MEAIYEYLEVTCKDKENSFRLLCYGYDESVDEIKIRTNIKETELKRGWIGDLHYSTGKSFNLKSEELGLKVEDAYKDVLLTSVRIWMIDENVITWEYTFLKK